MPPFSQFDCLSLWESGRALHPIDQALLAIETARPDTRRESVADWPLGRRNRALAEMHCANFGRSLLGWAACVACGEKLEFEVDAAQVASGATAEEEVQFGGRVLRLPTSRDLASLVSARDENAAATELVGRCTVSGESGELSEEELSAAGERLAAADPLAEILLHFDCPVCGASFEESLELAGFLWAELEGRAKRLLLDVHTLASAYGWSEGEVLALSPARRNFYIDRVQA